MRFLQASIAALMGACEVCVYNVGQVCARHKHLVKVGDRRCADFARRFDERPEQATKAQAERFIRDTLGLSEKSLNRIMGGPEP